MISLLKEVTWQYTYSTIGLLNKMRNLLIFHSQFYKKA